MGITKHAAVGAESIQATMSKADRLKAQGVAAKPAKKAKKKAKAKE